MNGRSATPKLVSGRIRPAPQTILTSMYFVYILLSEKDNKRYIGFTDDIERRLLEHNAGKVKSTKNRRPLKLICSEQFGNKSAAIKREREIKNKKGKFIIP